MRVCSEIGVTEVHVEQIDVTVKNLCTDGNLACIECVNLACIRELNMIKCEDDSVNNNDDGDIKILNIK